MNTTAYDFLINCNEESVTRARIALKCAMAGKWDDAANQYSMIMSESDGDVESAARELYEQCKRNAEMFSR